MQVYLGDDNDWAQVQDVTLESLTPEQLGELLGGRKVGIIGAWHPLEKYLDGPEWSEGVSMDASHEEMMAIARRVTSCAEPQWRACFVMIPTEYSR